ncbi:MAG: GTPase HflX [Candidatus Dormibacteria bacterium]
MKVFDEAVKGVGERAFLLGRSQGDDAEAVEREMEELDELARTAGAVVVGSDTQSRPKPDPALLFGRGKVAEIRALRQTLEFGLVIVNEELSPRQQRNLEEALGVPIVDRTGLILDIFAQHARSREGRVQVEVAQLRHLLPRLAGAERLSRMGGGIGMRGPGEQKLETDRRRIRVRLRGLEKDLKQLQEERSLRREARRRLPFRTVALVGYTNAGKSTLLNALTSGGARAEDKLFATLDPTTRALKLPDRQPCLAIDTVGFIQKLPHELVAAFGATLEEVTQADLLVHVLDASHAGAELRLETVHRTLRELGLEDRPMVVAINKIDLCSPESRARLATFQPSPYVGAELVSAKRGAGLDRLRRLIGQALSREMLPAEATISYDNWAALDRWRRYGVVDEEQFQADGIHVRGRLPPPLAEALRGRTPEEASSA